MPAEPVEVASRISDLVVTAPGAQIKGTELAAQIKSAFPQIAWSDYGCLNMRQFIDKHVTTVTIAGRAGMDYLYAVGDHSNGASAVQGTTALSPSLDNNSPESVVKLDIGVWWPPFAGPHAPFTLFANTETGQRRSLPVGENKPDGEHWVEVPRCDIEFFGGLAREFVATLRDDYEKGVLQAGIEKGTGPQSDFYQNVLKLGLRDAWNSFRQRRIISRFVGTLEQLGVPFRPRVQVASSGPRSLAVARSTPSALSLQPPSSSQSPKSRDDRLRRVALGAVARMSIHDLRGLHLPLGDVIDALEE